MFFPFPIRAMEKEIPVQVDTQDESTLPVGTVLVRQRTITRTVRSQKEIHDAELAELASLVRVYHRLQLLP